MSLDFNDNVVTRKLEMQLSRAGIGVHPGHEILQLDLGDATTCAEDIQQVILDLAIIHYELDFIVSSASGGAALGVLANEDNVYFAKALTEDQKAYLDHISALILTPEEVDVEDAETFKKAVTAEFAREGFARNENTRPGTFKIVSSALSKKSCDNADR